MSFDSHANFGYGTVTNNAGTAGATVVIGTANFAQFPDPSTNAYNVTIWSAGAIPEVANSEIARVTAKGTDGTLTVTRAQESTSNRDIVIGDQLALSITAKTLTDVEDSLTDGWIDATHETWTYASASTITVPTGAASRYKKGDRIKWTQTTVKYGVIVGVADTLLTIAINTDYTVANAAITNNYYSHQVNPIGYPNWFNTVGPTFVITPNYGMDNGSGSQPTTVRSKFQIIGNTCFAKWDGSGTKVGTDQEIKFNGQSAFPTPVNYSVLQIIGSHYTHSFLGGAVTAISGTEWRLELAAPVSDDTTISYISFIATYEI